MPSALCLSSFNKGIVLANIDDACDSWEADVSIPAVHKDSTRDCTVEVLVNRNAYRLMQTVAQLPGCIEFNSYLLASCERHSTLSGMRESSSFQEW